MMASEYLNNWAQRKLKTNPGMRATVTWATRLIAAELDAVELSDQSGPAMRHALESVVWSGIYAPRSCQTIKKILNMALEGAVDDELLARNPLRTRKVKLPAAVDKNPGARAGWRFDRDEAIQLLESAHLEPHERIYLYLGFFSGVRFGEAVAIRAQDWNRPRHALNVSAGYSRNKRCVSTTKTGAVKEVPLHPALEAALEWYAGVKAPRSLSPGSFLCSLPNKPGLVYQHSTALKMMARVCRAEGMRTRTPHDMRRTFISSMCEAGAIIDIVRRWTHAKPNDSFSIYLMPSWESQCREMAKLDWAPRLPALPTPAPRSLSR